MQADEDVGKIALAVPLLVSKALELFLQDLCDRTYEITLQRGAKTMSASHLKQCVQRFNVFDFLRETVNKVPDLGGSDVTGDERNGTRRRKVLEEDDNESEEEFKRARMDLHHGSGRGRGRRRGRGRGARAGKSSERSLIAHEKFEDEELDLSPNHSDKCVKSSEKYADVAVEAREYKGKVGLGSTPVVEFDLNMDLDENGNVLLTQPNVKCVEQYPSWYHSHVDNNVTMDPLQLHVHLDRTLDQDEDDYDNEDG